MDFRNRLAAFLLFVCLLIFAGGYQLLYYVQLHSLKQDLKERLLAKPALAETFSFAGQQVSGIEWENDHEFFIEGKIYDLVKKEVRGDSLVLYAFADGDEQVLIDKLAKTAKSRHGEPGGTILAKILNTPFLASHPFNYNIPFTTLMRAYGGPSDSYSESSIAAVDHPPATTWPF